VFKTSQKRQSLIFFVQISRILNFEFSLEIHAPQPGLAKSLSLSPGLVKSNFDFLFLQWVFPLLKQCCIVQKQCCKMHQNRCKDRKMQSSEQYEAAKFKKHVMRESENCSARLITLFWFLGGPSWLREVALCASGVCVLQFGTRTLAYSSSWISFAVSCAVAVAIKKTVLIKHLAVRNLPTSSCRSCYKRA
jgi:hypothetical protein